LSFNIIIGLFAGLSLFVFGMKLMSEGLQKTAGKKLRYFLEILTTQPIMGVLIGTGVTAIIQSSSATTVMVVGFVNAGLMTLAQSIGVIMGANIGTTVTAQLIAFKLGDYAYHAITVGGFAYLFSKKKKAQYFGQILLGFGILFLGLNTMSNTMLPLRDSIYFVTLMKKFSVFPIFGVIAGIFVTALIQSSSATFGILFGLVSTGILDYQAGIPILLGSNIGTTITAILSSVGANLNAKKAAAAHFTFNVLGAGLVIGLLYIIPDFANKISVFLNSLFKLFGRTSSPERLLANTHTLFNIVNTLIWLPFIGFMVKFVNKIIPGQDDSIKRGLYYIDDRMLKTPTLAIEQVRNEIVRMFEIAQSMVCESNNAFLKQDIDFPESIKKKEDIVNEIEEDLLQFLTKIPQSSLSDVDIKVIDKYFAIIDAIESIADDADDIADLTIYCLENKVTFSDEAYDSLENAFEFNCNLLRQAITLVEKQDYNLIDIILEGEKTMDRLQLQYRDSHTKRMNIGKCELNAGIAYLEVIDDLEHVSDQLADIAHCIAESYLSQD